MIRPSAALAAVLLLLAALAPARAQSPTPQALQVQGFLRDSAGGTPQPANGSYAMLFRLFDDELAGSLLGSVGPLAVDVADGLYQVELDFPAALFGGSERWLEIEVEGETLAPRLRLVSAPFAYVAETLDGHAAAELEESAEITDAVAAHDNDPNAHASVLADFAASAVASHALDPDAHREHASLEESAEIVAAVAAHAAAPDAHPGYVQAAGDTMTGPLTIAAPASDALLLSSPGPTQVGFSAGGATQTLGWDEAESTFRLSAGLAFDDTKLLRWPMVTGPSAGIATYSFSKAATNPPGQDQHPDGELDETFQFCYNCAPGGGTFRADDTQHGWNQKFEANFWNGIAQHEQLEVNWNYTAPDGYKWRPYAFTLQTTANCSGGTASGARCVTPAEESACVAGGGMCQGDNWARFSWEASGFGYCVAAPSVRCMDDTGCPSGTCLKNADVEVENGRGRLFSRQGLYIDVTQPGGFTASSYSALQAQQDLAPTGAGTPYFGGVINSTFGADAQAGSAPSTWIGLRTNQVFGGSAPDGRYVTTRIVGVDVVQELSQTALAGQAGSGETIPEVTGLSWELRPTGSQLSVGAAIGLYVESPDPLGAVAPVTIEEFDGVRVDDLKGYGTSNRALFVATQSGGDAEAGNIEMEGGGATDGHLKLGRGHVWFDPGSGLLRSRDEAAGAPQDDADGTPLHAPPGMSDAWGQALWGATGSAVGSAAQVCANAGLDCVRGFDLGTLTDRSCGYSNWSAPFFLAMCK